MFRLGLNIVTVYLLIAAIYLLICSVRKKNQKNYRWIALIFILFTVCDGVMIFRDFIISNSISLLFLPVQAITVLLLIIGIIIGVIKKKKESVSRKKTIIFLLFPILMTLPLFCVEKYVINHCSIVMKYEVRQILGDVTYVAIVDDKPFLVSLNSDSFSDFHNSKQIYLYKDNMYLGEITEEVLKEQKNVLCVDTYYIPEIEGYFVEVAINNEEEEKNGMIHYYYTTRNGLTRVNATGDISDVIYMK